MAKSDSVEFTEKDYKELSVSGIKKRLIKKYGDSVLTFPKNERYDGIKYILPKFVAYSDGILNRDLFRITYKDSFAHGYTIYCRWSDGMWYIVERKVTLFGVKDIRSFHEVYKDPLDALEFVISRDRYDEIEESRILIEGDDTFKVFRYFVKNDDNRFILYEDEKGVTIIGIEGGIPIKMSGSFLLNFIDSFLKSGYKEVDSSTYNKTELYNQLLYDISL